MADQTVWASTANRLSIVPGSSMTAESGPTLNQDRWSEHFQDLSGYCNIGSRMQANSEAPSGEQLNTPNIIVQDEFNFGLRSSPGERFDLFDDSNPWEASAPINTSQSELWGTVNSWLSTSNRKGGNDEETIDLIDVDDIDPDETPFDIVSTKRPLVKADGDYLLSQSATDPSPPTKELNREQSYIDLVSLLNPDKPFENDGEQRNLLQSQRLTADLRNKNNTFNMNNVLNNNKPKTERFPLKTEQQTGQQSNFFMNVSPTLRKPINVIKSEPLIRDNVNNSFMNRRDPENRSVNNLSSIFKSEEPLIGESTKTTCSAPVMANKEPLKVTTIIITPKLTMSPDSTMTQIVQTKYLNSYEDQNEYILPEIKSEPIDIADMEVETINEHDNTVARRFKMPPNDNSPFGVAKKPGLKLDIDSAARLVTNVITPTITPTTTSSIIGEGNVSLSTPDVLRPLLNSNGEFNLLSFMGEDDVVEDIERIPVNFSADVNRNSPVVSKSNPVTSKCERRRDKTETVENRSRTGHDLPTLTVVKEEIVDDSHETDEYSTPSKRNSRSVSKRRRVAKRSDDMEFDIDNLSDYEEEDDEKHDKTFELTPYRRKRTISSTSRTSSSPHYSGRSRHLRDTDSSDHESVGSNVDRYRELRDRNNEASRRSRLNRKSRECEMKKHAVELEQENKRLKAKADEMEKLVKRLREGLMQLVLKKQAVKTVL